MEIKFDTKTIVIMIVEAALFMGLLIGVSTCQGHKLDVANNNIEALRDSVECLELKNGELMYEKQALVLERDELQEYLDLSKQEIKDIEKKLQSKLAYIAKLEGQVKVPVIIVKDSLIYISKDTARFNFDYLDDKWLSFNGLGEVTGGKVTTTLSNINVPMPLKVGLTNENTIFVTTENPYVEFTDIQGAVLDGSKSKQKPKHWNVGIQLGIGAQYGLVNKQFDAGPYLGVGIAYGFGF